MMYPASFYRNTVNRQVQCTLCPHFCNLLPGEIGLCQSRTNRGGKLFCSNYGIISAVATDPIEKKPLYHFYPGSSILSIGSIGCNLNCDFCQNCKISQPEQSALEHYPFREPEDLIQKTLLHRDSIGLAYTYNEPTVYYEFMIACAEKLRVSGMKNVMVSNGYINREPLLGLIKWMDAFNIDLKSFRNDFYRKRTGASLRPVLDTIALLAASEAHLELTFLIIPGHNDSRAEWKDMIRWIEDNCGPDTILHVSKYFPRHKLQDPPTPTHTMQAFLDLAREKIHYVYPGNNPQLENHSYCPGCGTMLIERSFYSTKITGLSSDGHCTSCNTKIKGEFKIRPC